MKKFRNGYGDVITENDLKKHYKIISKETTDILFPDTFERFLERALNKNGDLEEIASESEILNKRRWTAVKIAAETNAPYEDVLRSLTEMNVHGNWTSWEIKNRPTDIEELIELIDEGRQE